MTSHAFELGVYLVYLACRAADAVARGLRRVVDWDGAGESLVMRDRTRG